MLKSHKVAAKATATAIAIIISQIISQSGCMIGASSNTIRLTQSYNRQITTRTRGVIASAFQSYYSITITKKANVHGHVPIEDEHPKKFSLSRTGSSIVRGGGGLLQDSSTRIDTTAFRRTSERKLYHVHGFSSSKLFSSVSESDQDRDQKQDRGGVQMHHFESVKSTQDEARRILHDSDNTIPNQYFAVTTASQTNGRGTNGRSWIGQKGNSFLTIAIPSNDLTIPLTLFPLQIGCVIAQRVQEMIQRYEKSGLDTTPTAKVTVKWPNDVLVNQKKIAGVLIESEQDHAGNYYFLVGIGVNYKYAPKVETTGPQMGRESTCICDHIHCDDVDDDEDGVEASKCLGRDIANDVTNWVELQKTWEGAGDAIIANWERFFESGTKLIMRDDPAHEVVTSICIEKDGRLRVRGQDGKDRLLCHDYLL